MNTLPEPPNAEYERVVRTHFGRQALVGTIGAWLVEVGPGRVLVELPYSARIAQQPGHFHGAVIGALGEMAGVSAALTLMPSGHEVLSIEYKVNFLMPACGLLLRANANVVGALRGLVTTRMEVSVLGGPADGLCAVIQATMQQVPQIVPQPG